MGEDLEPGAQKGVAGSYIGRSEMRPVFVALLNLFGKEVHADECENLRHT